MTYLLNFALRFDSARWRCRGSFINGCFAANIAKGLRRSFGAQVPQRKSERPCIWFHAVSVGEVNLLSVLLKQLRSRSGPTWNASFPRPR